MSDGDSRLHGNDRLASRQNDEFTNLGCTPLAPIIHDYENVQAVIPVETGIHRKQLTLA